MENELKLLRKLQEFDLEIDEIHERGETIQAEFDELVARHSSLSQALEAQRAELDEARRLMEQKVRELAENNENHQAHKEKQSKVTTAKELSAVEKELDSLRRRKAQLEEEHDQLRDSVRDAEDDVEEKQERTNEIAAEMSQQEALIQAETERSKTRIVELEAARDELKGQFAAGPSLVALRRYEFIRQRLPGRVIVVARSGACTGCNMMIPPQIYNELQDGKKFIQCPNCKRILYYEEPI